MSQSVDSAAAAAAALDTIFAYLIILASILFYSITLLSLNVCQVFMHALSF